LREKRKERLEERGEERRREEEVEPKLIVRHKSRLTLQGQVNISEE
jgi:hypothetical protein